MGDSDDRFEMRKGWFLLSTAGTSQSGDQMKALAEHFVAEARRTLAAQKSQAPAPSERPNAKAK